MFLTVGIVQTAFETGLIYSLVALSLFISFTILDVCDLSTDGCYTLGCAVGALVTLAGHPILAIFASMAAGILSGFITGILQTTFRVQSILAGIIVNTGLYTINLAVMGFKSNVAIFGTDTVFSMFKSLSVSEFWQNWSSLILLLLIVGIVAILMFLFLGTRLGLSIRATGDSPAMVRASSINVDFSLIFGLALANGLIALSGALISHYLGLSDQSFSNGTLIYGLAAVIIGEAIFGKRNVALGLTSAVVGSVIYKIIVAFVIDVSLFGKNSENLMKLTCAIIVAITLVVPEIKHKFENAKSKKEARKNA